MLLLLLVSLFNLNSQGDNNLKLRIEPGFLLLSESENLGLLLNIEPKIKISDNTVIGLRFGIALNTQKLQNNNTSQFFFDNQGDNAVLSFLPTFDYYLNKNKYRPFLGAGIGYYVFNYIDVFRRNSSASALEGSVKNQVGILLRGGFEFGNKRLGLEYNLIPKADIKVPNSQVIGTVNNSYIGLLIGFQIE